jgi:hypothetical protein
VAESGRFQTRLRDESRLRRAEIQMCRAPSLITASSLRRMCDLMVGISEHRAVVVVR